MIVSRWAAYINNPPEWCRKEAAVYFFSPHRVLCGLRSQKSFRINRPLRSPISFYGYLPPLSRRSYQPENRFSSVSRPSLNVSGAASPLCPNELRGRGFHQTTTIGLRRLELRLDYAGEGGEERGRWSAK